MIRRKAVIYVEGGGKELTPDCRAAFQELLDKMGFRGRKPRIVPCGSRNDVFDKFTTELKRPSAEWAAMWLDSEDPISDKEQTWAHLNSRDNWPRPENVDDEQVLLMTTCMETWIVTDRQTLRQFYGQHLMENRLPQHAEPEEVSRQTIQDSL